MDDPFSYKFYLFHFQAALQVMSCPEPPLPNLFNEIRTWARNDRTVFDKAQRAFVSYIQAYSKHECKWVLRVKGTNFKEILKLSLNKFKLLYCVFQFLFKLVRYVLFLIHIFIIRS